MESFFLTSNAKETNCYFRIIFKNCGIIFELRKTPTKRYAFISVKTNHLKMQLFHFFVQFHCTSGIHQPSVSRTQNTILLQKHLDLNL